MHLHYGSSVHKACEFAVKYAIENQKYPQKDDFINAFITKLNNLPLSSIEQRNILQTRGEKALSEYYSRNYAIHQFPTFIKQKWNCCLQMKI